MRVAVELSVNQDLVPVHLHVHTNVDIRKLTRGREKHTEGSGGRAPARAAYCEDRVLDGPASG